MRKGGWVMEVVAVREIQAKRTHVKMTSPDAPEVTPGPLQRAISRSSAKHNLTVFEF